MLDNANPHCNLRKKESNTDSKSYHDLNIDYINSMISFSVLAVFVLAILFAL